MAFAVAHFGMWGNEGRLEDGVENGNRGPTRRGVHSNRFHAITVQVLAVALQTICHAKPGRQNRYDRVNPKWLDSIRREGTAVRVW